LGDVYGVVLSENQNIGVDEEWDRVGEMVVFFVVDVSVGLVDFVSGNE